MTSSRRVGRHAATIPSHATPRAWQQRRPRMVKDYPRRGRQVIPRLHPNAHNMRPPAIRNRIGSRIRRQRADASSGGFEVLHETMPSARHATPLAADGLPRIARVAHSLARSRGWRRAAIDRKLNRCRYQSPSDRESAPSPARRARGWSAPGALLDGILVDPGAIASQSRRFGEKSNRIGLGEAGSVAEQPCGKVWGRT